LLNQITGAPEKKNNENWLVLKCRV